MKKYLISLFLPAALTLALLESCGPEDSQTSGFTTTPAPQTTASDTTPAPETTVTPAPTVPEKVSLEGKTIYWLGSSVTYGSANNGVSMVDMLREKTGCTCLKYAVSGTTLVDSDSNSYVSRMKASIKRTRKVDYFICQLSTNDASQNKNLGTVSDSFDIEDFDTQTVCGAIEYIIACAKDTWNCPVAFYTGPRYNSEPYQKMVDALLRIQEKWGIYVLDFWNDPDYLAMTPAQQKKFLGQYMADDIHPNAKGYEEWWTPAFEDFISTTIAK